MRRHYLFLFLLFLFLLPGCKSETVHRNPVKFYYPKAQISYGVSDGVLSHEPREGASLTVEALLCLYLEGPSTDGLVSPFPDDINVVHFSLQEDEAILVLSDNYATLAGLDMSMANICVAKTVMALTGAKSVTLSCQTQSLSGEPRITISESDLMLYDESAGPVSLDNSPTASTSQ